MAIVRRRQSPPQFSDYKRYKPYLRRDFRFRCCYCCIHEVNWATQRHFAVEHFRPKKKFPELETQYSNLYYACDDCNGYKSDKWPDPSDLLAGRRFFDPCADPSVQHFKDEGLGLLTAVSACGSYSILSIRLNRPLLVSMRNDRRELAAKFRALRKETRYFRQLLPKIRRDVRELVDLLIAKNEQKLEEIRTKYYRPPEPEVADLPQQDS